jgi:hypothetical protein
VYGSPQLNMRFVYRMRTSAFKSPTDNRRLDTL